MRRHGSGLAIGALLVLGLCLLATNNTASADDDDEMQIKKAQQDILDLAKSIEAGKIDAKRALAIRKKYEDLYHLMIGFKPRDRKGIGYGQKGEGIELKLSRLAKRAILPRQLAAEKNNLLKMGYINLAYAEILPHYAPARPNAAGKGAKEWRRFSADMKAASRELIAAVNKGDPAALKKAANSLTDSCNDCHR